MTRNRLEAFSDGVMAIIITIMVLELKAPKEPSWSALKPLVPEFLCYLLSFAFLGVYWNNHHHLLHTVRHVSGSILWANMHLLFWLSLTPFTTHWMGKTDFAADPVAAYGVVLFLSAVAYYILTRTIIAHHGRDSTLAHAVGNDRKGLISLAIYAAAIGVAYVEPRAACGLYALVAVMWFVPDRRIERTLDLHNADNPTAA